MHITVSRKQVIILFTTFEFIHSHINIYTMFILRKLFKEHGKNSFTESNQIIGDNYSTVTEHNDGWDHLNKEWESLSQNIFCFIIYNHGADVIPLYKDQSNYIMTSDGKTFSHINYIK